MGMVLDKLNVIILLCHNFHVFNDPKLLIALGTNNLRPDQMSCVHILDTKTNLCVNIQT